MTPEQFCRWLQGVAFAVEHVGGHPPWPEITTILNQVLAPEKKIESVSLTKLFNESMHNKRGNTPVTGYPYPPTNPYPCPSWQIPYPPKQREML